ncbi:cell division control protein 14, SIN component-domain-containing protein [Trametes polyzona]|nr:cell division control protein 14, SIN component-domain-containing protein [Trametes polyzona]
MHEILQDALDELSSSRTSLADKGEALVAIEHVLAETCDPRAEGLLGYFNALQDTFQCNVSLRIISWVAATSSQLESCLDKGSTDRAKKADAAVLASQLSQAMAIIQGVVLTHKPSKQSLGRRYPLEVLLDLLLVSRHLEPSSTPSSNVPTSPKAGASSAPCQNSSGIPLASVIIDTMLCILVDSVTSLRVFEDLNGVQVVVRILKRAGTPREVRMKCLEFLYFYLLDETTSVTESSNSFSSSTFTTPEATPASSPAPPHRSYPSLSAASDASYTTASSSRSSSASSAFSACSTSTAATSRSLHELATSQKAELVKQLPTTTQRLPTPAPKSVIPGLVPSHRTVTPPSNSAPLNALGRGQPRSLLMLRKEVDYVPLSPKKPEISHLGHRPSGLRPKLRERTNASTRLRAAGDVLSSEDTESEEHPVSTQSPAPSTPRPRASMHSRGLSVSSISSMSSTSSSITSGSDSHPSTPRASREDSKGKTREPLQTPKLSSKLHRRTQSLADVAMDSPAARLSGAEQMKVGPRSASSPTAAAGSAKKGPRTMEEKKEILGSMLGNVDALVEGVRKAGIWGLS